MSVIGFSQDDILRSKIVEPGFYLVDIKEVSEEMAKDGKSKNYKIDKAVIMRNADNGDEKYGGVPLPPNWQFNSKRLDFLVGFYEALTGSEVTAETKMEWKGVAGNQIVAFIGNGEWNGAMQNQVKNSYRHKDTSK